MPRTTVYKKQIGKLKAIVTVTSPDLTPEERARRWKKIEAAASDLMKDCINRGIIDINDLEKAE